MIVIYGDTDSIFINSELLNNKLDIENEVKAKFGVEISKDKEWHTFAQFGKKEYSGVLSDGKYVTKQIYGMRDDKPKHFSRDHHYQCETSTRRKDRCEDGPIRHASTEFYKKINSPSQIRRH